MLGVVLLFIDESLLASAIVRGRAMMRTSFCSLKRMVLSVGEQTETLCTMLTSMLIMITKTIHIFVAPLTTSNSTNKGSQAFLGLFFYLHKVVLCDTVFCGKLCGGGNGTSGRIRERQAKIDMPFTLASSLTLFALKEILDMLQVLGGSKVAAAMSHVVLEAVCLLVALVTV